MYCNSCGMEIQKESLQCQYCGEIKSEDERNYIEEVNALHQENKVFNQKYARRKKVIKIASFFLLLLIVIAYLRSDSGRIIQARVCMAFHNPDVAYSIVNKGLGEEAFIYQEYADVIMRVKKLQEMSTGEDILKAVNELSEKANELSHNRHFLKKRELEKVTSIQFQIEKYHNARKEIQKFDENLNSACKIYTTFHEMDAGESFDAERVKQDFIKWRKALEEANAYYRLIMSSDMSEYAEIFTAFVAGIEEMDRIIQKSEDCSAIYYTKFSLDERFPTPFAEKEVKSLSDEINKKTINTYFGKII